MAVTADSRAQTVSRKDEGRKAGTPAAATVASPVKAPPPAEQTNAESGDRPSQLQKTYTSLLEQARAGKMRYLKAARLYEEKVQSLYPEESGNALMNEYLAYMAVIGEKIDQRKLTEAEGQYELARKVSELQERAIAIHARAIAAQQTQQTELARKAREEAAARQVSADAAERKAREEAAAREVAAQRSLEEQRLALERELAEKQLKQQRADALMQAGILLLAQPWRYAAPLPNAPVTCRWFANNWICQ